MRPFVRILSPLVCNFYSSATYARHCAPRRSDRSRRRSAAARTRRIRGWAEGLRRRSSAACDPDRRCNWPGPDTERTQCRSRSPRIQTAYWTARSAVLWSRSPHSQTRSPPYPCHKHIHYRLIITHQTSTTVLVILGRKCTLAVSRAAQWWVTLSMRRRDKRTDGRQTVTLRLPTNAASILIKLVTIIFLTYSTATRNVIQRTVVIWQYIILAQLILLTGSCTRSTQRDARGNTPQSA